MRTVLLVPRRADDGHRDRLWAWCRRRWGQVLPDVPIYEGHHLAAEGPFNRSAAINRAARAADVEGRWDLGIVIDADIFIRRSQVRAAIARARKTGKVTWAHRRWRNVNDEWTKRIVNKRLDLGPELASVDMDVLVDRTTPMSWSCCVVVPRLVYDDIGGFDERFVGWGFEDMAFQSVVCGLYGWERIEGDVIHLDHPRSLERIVKGLPAWTASPEYIANGRLGRRYMYALRRDHGLTERPESADAEEIARDLRNLETDDRKFAALQTASERAKWDGWWPTLEELLAGARDSVRSVSVIVHSGGEPETWDERSGYLRRSLASLIEQVHGPIVQRVVYSDWGDALRPAVERIAREFGFYVAGEGHVGYTASMRRLWGPTGYMNRRATGSYIFATEDDFVYDRPVDLVPMVLALSEHSHLAQIVLLRGAYYPRELEGPGILGWPEDRFKRIRHNGVGWLEHRLFFSANPSLFRRQLAAEPWPSGPSSERLFGDSLTRRDRDLRFAFWGSGEAWVSHIGATRASSAY